MGTYADIGVKLKFKYWGGYGLHLVFFAYIMLYFIEQSFTHGATYDLTKILRDYLDVQ